MPVIRDNEYWVTRLTQMQGDRSAVEKKWQEAGEYIFPDAADMYTVKKQEGTTTFNDREVFDSTAINAANLLARSVHGMLTPPNAPWVDYRARIKERDKVTDLEVEKLQAWLDEAKEDIWKAITHSNFDAQAAIFYKYLVVFTPGNMFVEHAFNKQDGLEELIFTAFSPKELYVSRNAKGALTTVIRLYELSAEQIEDEWPGTADKSKKIQDALEDKPNTKFEILHVVSPKKENEATNDKAHLFINKNILKEDSTDLGDPHKGYYSFPTMSAPWERLRGDDYGSCPGINVIATTRSLNYAVKIQFASYDKLLDPPIVVGHGALKPGEKIKGGAKGVTELMGNVDEIRALTDTGRWDVAEHLIVEMRRQVEKGFYIDQIQLPPMEKTPHSATEVQAQIETQQRILGPLFGTLRDEFLAPLMDRIFEIMKRKNMLPKKTPFVEKIFKKTHIDFEFVGPLAKAQEVNRSNSIKALLYEYAQLMQSVGELAPELMFVFDFRKIFQFFAESKGVPREVFLSDKEAQARLQQFQQAQQAQQAAALAEQAAGADKDLAVAGEVRAKTGAGNGR